MKSQPNKRFIQLLSWMALSAMLLTGCGIKQDSHTPEADASQAPAGSQTSAVEEPDLPTELSVRFGSGGEAFTLYLEDNQTAQDIARHVGTADWNLPIYHYDDYDGWESFQYYDIPSRYEITSAPETVTSEKAGEVYYSEPNRIVLFYHNAEISGEYTLIGTFDATDAFVATVENNPVLEGWGNKIVNVSPN